jgi:hypothetical protein
MTQQLIFWNFTGLNISIDPGVYGIIVGYYDSTNLADNLMIDSSNSASNPLPLSFGGTNKVFDLNVGLNQISSVKCTVINASKPSGSKYPDIYTAKIVNQAVYNFQVDNNMLSSSLPGSYVDELTYLHIVFGVSATGPGIITNYPLTPDIKYIGPRGEILDFNDVYLAYPTFFKYGGQSVLTYGIEIVPTAGYTLNEILWGMSPLCNQSIISTAPPV